MPFQVSPGVAVREIDLTTIVPAVSTTEGAIAGVFRWGPIDQRVLIDSEIQLASRFGKPTNLNAETWFTAASFLGYGNRLYVSRAANTTGITPSCTANIVANASIVTITGNTTTGLGLETGLVVSSVANGSLRIGATIASIINSTAFRLSSNTDSLKTGTGINIDFVSDTAFNAIANSGPVANLEYAIIKNEEHFLAKDGSEDSDLHFTARYPGELGNSLRISVCGNADGFASQINLASGDYSVNNTSSSAVTTYFDVKTNSNSSLVVIAGANSSLVANAATLFKNNFQVTDNIEVGNVIIGTQLMKITSIGSTTTHGTANVLVDITTSEGNNIVLVSSTTNIVNNMIVIAANTSGNNAVNSLVGLRVASVINSTAISVVDAPTANLSNEPVTVAPTAVFTINFEDPYKLSGNYRFSSNSNTALTNISSPNQLVQRYWEYVNFVDSAPGQSEYVRNFGNSAINNDELHIVVTDEGGKFTGVPGTILETYRNVSRATDAKTIDGATNYWKDVINDASQYVYAINDISGAASNTALNLTDSTLDVQTLSFTLGRDGKDEATIPLGVLSTAYDKFASAEDVDISLVLQGRARGFQLANYIIDNICETRLDCVAFISPQKADVVNNIGNEAAAVVNFRNNVRSTSYAVMDSGYKYMYDRYNDIYRWIPLNGDTAGLCVRTDTTNDPWWSPAGFNRGQIKNLVKLAYNPRKADRDTLYKAGVNPVVTFPGQGTILFGDKTLLAKPSAFDRINVRRLFIVLEKAISTASKFTLFEFNDAFTRSQFKNLVVPYLRDVQGRRGIYDFLVVCDETNNTPEVIDRNEFIGDIYIKPARSINFIQLNFVAVRTGVAFSEIIGKF